MIRELARSSLDLRRLLISGLLDPEATRQWFAACTRSNHEKCAATQLEGDAIEHFLPLYESVRKWKDRRKRLELPLFPGYLFVRIPLEQRLRVLVTPGVVRLVGFDNRPAALPDGEIEALRSCAVARGSLRATSLPDRWPESANYAWGIGRNGRRAGAQERTGAPGAIH